MTNIVRGLDQDKYSAHLLVIAPGGELLRSIPNHVDIIHLNNKRVSRSLFKLFKVIKNVKPQVIFSNMFHVNILTIATMLLLGNVGIKLIIRETIIPSYTITRSKYRQIYGFMLKVAYNSKAVSTIVCQGEYMKNDIVSRFNIIPDKIVVINNPVDIHDIRLKSILPFNFHISEATINLVLIARLEHIKGHDLLLEIFSGLPRGAYHLYIVGTGSMKTKIESDIESRNLQGEVTLLGHQSNPYSLLKRMDLFLLTSRSDPFPNAVLEALSLGVPVIAFKTPGGIEEIMVPGMTGELVAPGDIRDYRAKILDYSREKHPRTKIKRYVELQYGKNILKKYDNIFS
jgi:glycosyltransferase involved in cell wall biosynthesis